jgi:hypothetical protein
MEIPETGVYYTVLNQAISRTERCPWEVFMMNWLRIATANAPRGGRQENPIFQLS